MLLCWEGVLSSSPNGMALPSGTSSLTMCHCGKHVAYFSPSHSLPVTDGGSLALIVQSRVCAGSPLLGGTGRPCCVRPLLGEGVPLGLRFLCPWPNLPLCSWLPAETVGSSLQPPKASALQLLGGSWGLSSAPLWGIGIQLPPCSRVCESRGPLLNVLMEQAFIHKSYEHISSPFL